MPQTRIRLSISTRQMEFKWHLMRWQRGRAFKSISLKLKFTANDKKLLSKTPALLRRHSAGTIRVNGANQPAGPAAFKYLLT